MYKTQNVRIIILSNGEKVFMHVMGIIYSKTYFAILESTNLRFLVCVCVEKDFKYC